ncbi:hypothetical protein T439DRAFT_329611 [Meredithblackwellia eburnea MCA 4105]
MATTLDNLPFDVLSIMLQHLDQATRNRRHSRQDIMNASLICRSFRDPAQRQLCSVVPTQIVINSIQLKQWIASAASDIHPLLHLRDDRDPWEGHTQRFEELSLQARIQLGCDDDQLLHRFLDAVLRKSGHSLRHFDVPNGLCTTLNFLKHPAVQAVKALRFSNSKQLITQNNLHSSIPYPSTFPQLNFLSLHLPSLQEWSGSKPVLKELFEAFAASKSVTTFELGLDDAGIAFFVRHLSLVGPRIKHLRLVNITRMKLHSADSEEGKVNNGGGALSSFTAVETLEFEIVMRTAFYSFHLDKYGEALRVVGKAFQTIRNGTTINPATIETIKLDWLPPSALSELMPYERSDFECRDRLLGEMASMLRHPVLTKLKSIHFTRAPPNIFWLGATPALNEFFAIANDRNIIITYRS